MMSALVVPVDVDETFVRSDATAGIPIPAVQQIRRPHGQEAALSCRGSGGADDAHERAPETGTDGNFLGSISEPPVMIDDQNVPAWRRLVRVHPMSCEGQGVEVDRKQ